MKALPFSVFLFSNKARTGFWTAVSVSGVVISLDSLLTILIAQRFGGFAAVGGIGLGCLVFGTLIYLKATGLRALVFRNARHGLFLPGLIHRYVGLIGISFLAASPGLLSTAVALVFYPAPLSRFIGSIIIGKEPGALSMIHEHLSH